MQNSKRVLTETADEPERQSILAAMYRKKSARYARAKTHPLKCT